MRLALSCTIAARLPRLLDELARPAMLYDLAAPMVVFEPLTPVGEHWEDGPHRFRLLIGGRLPIGEHTIDVKTRARGVEDVASDGIVWHDAGHSPLIRRWDHRIALRRLSGGGVRYTDLVEVEAGLLTLPAWLFARAFYAHRQRRLRARALGWRRRD